MVRAILLDTFPLSSTAKLDEHSPLMMKLMCLGVVTQRGE